MDISSNPHCESVIRDPNLLHEISVRVSSKRAVLRSTTVHKKWKAAVKARDFLQSYTDRHAPCLMGFLVKFESIYGKSFQMFDAEEKPANETVAKLLALVDRDDLESDIIVGSTAGLVLTLNRHRPSGYSVSCPSISPKIYTQVAASLPAIPRLPNQHTDNTWGQFGVIPHVGPEGMSFFARDSAGESRRSCRGVTFDSEVEFHIHVSVYSNSRWNRLFSDTIHPEGSVTFHKYPYSILHRKQLFMIYIVGLIVSFDLEHKTFSVIHLPDPMNVEVVSDMQYSISANTKGELTLVFYRNSCLYNFKLGGSDDDYEWVFLSSIDLVSIFYNKFGDQMWTRFLMDEPAEPDYHIIQIRRVWSDGKFIMLTLGFDHGLFVLDTEKESLTEMENIRPVGRVAQIYTLSEPWPPNL